MIATDEHLTRAVPASGWRMAVGLAVLGLMLALPAAQGADKSGVSPNTISVPKGPGSVEGLGESFQPTLNTGTAKYGLGIKLPPGTAGHQPSLSLSYEGGGGNGPLGYGWSLSVPHLQRRTDEGIPNYGEALGVDRPDRFINEMREELVPTADGFWFCENEGAFLRYRRVADHWEGTAPDGTRLEFGLTANGRIEEGTSGRIFGWLLERETDTRGNVIEYGYRSFPGEQNLNQKYLALVRYGPGPPPWSRFHFVAFDYEDRRDGFEDGRPGFLVRTGKRLKAIVVGTQGIEAPGHLAGDFDGDGAPDALDRRYDLEYLVDAGAASHGSLLAKVTLIGADGVTALPPATFGYAVTDPPDTLDVSSNVWGSIDEPLAVMDNSLVDLVDLNADGLPDVLRTESGGGAHTAWINRGPARQGAAWAVQWAPPEAVDPGPGIAWNFNLESDHTHLADMDGDGLADLVHKSAEGAVFFFANRGRVAWGERREMSVENTAPPAPFGDPTVRTADVDFDKRIDLIQSLDLGGGVGYRIWFNLGLQTYSAPFTIEPEGGFDFTLTGVQLADCNGDRVPDVARIRPEAVRVAAGLGYGRFAPPRDLPLPDFTLDDLQVAAAKLVDINGDGLADLVLERAVPGECWYWLNLGNSTLSSRKRLTGLPVVSSTTTVRWADLNGNGTTDLVYADSQGTPRLQCVEIGQALSGGLAPNTLIRLSNGIGRVTRIDYAPSTRFALEDSAAGRSWPDPLPFPVTVVSQLTVSDSLGHEYVTRFRYHDGYYDAEEKQFRGFAEVEQIEVGDAAAPTRVSRSHFDTGRAHDALKGRLLRTSAETEDGRVFGAETTTWTDPPRVLHTGTNGLSVRFAHPTASAQDVLELGRGTPRRLESEFDYDAYGNQTRLAQHGIVEGTHRAAFNDERITTTEFALNLDAWILRLPRRQETADENGLVLSRTESFYDDETFSGTNFGAVIVGNLTLRRDWIDPADPANFVASARTRYDALGNPVAQFDPWSDGTGKPGEGHFRELAYDDGFHAYPVRETIHVGAGHPPLVFEATYDQGLATVTRSTDLNGQTTTYGYDALGRLTSVIRPGDTPAYPTVEYDYALAVPADAGRIVNHIETRQLDQAEIRDAKSARYQFSRQYVDGLGRALMTRAEAEPAEGSSEPRVVVSGSVLFNARQQPASTLNPFFTRRTGSLEERLAWEDLEAPGWRGQFHEQGNLVERDLPSAHRSSTEYDATLRAVKTTHPDGTFARTEYEPLVVRSLDENDVDPVSPHYDTPTVQFADGLGRLIRVDEIVRLNDDGTPAAMPQTWTTRYEYDLNDRLTRITDSQDNVKQLRYDGLQRRVWMNDPDAGLSTNRYDAASNLIETTDAKGQRIAYTYDGANRILTEDFHDETSPEFSYHRTPDVRYHYDSPAGPVDQGDGTSAIAENTRGRLAWVEDPSGEEHTSFDARGRIAWTVKRLPDPVLSPTLDPAPAALVAYRTAFAYDPMDRVTRLIYPDNDEVNYRYGARGLLEGIGGDPGRPILGGVTYLPSAQPEHLDFGNGVRTTYSYDSRLRLSELLTRHAGRGTDLVHFTYDLDPASNLDAIHDQRPVSAIPLDDPRRNSQRFEYDDLYRLVRAQYNLPSPASANGGRIDYRYDRIGNLLGQTSDIVHEERGVPVTDLGSLDYGGSGGRSGRVGRGAQDPPGPHALTSARRSSLTTRRFPYDANGNMTEIDGLRCTWDFRDRLVAVEDETMRARYRYDYTGRRIIKQVFWKQGEPAPPPPPSPARPQPATTSVEYPGREFEVREHDQPAKYVFSGATRVARITGSLSSGPRIQRLRLHAGWNLCSIAVEGATLPSDPRLGSVRRWDPATGDYVRVSDGERLAAGAVLWMQASAQTVLAVVGESAEPVPRAVPAGGGFVPGPGLDAWPVELPPGTVVWRYDAATRSWQTGLASDLATMTDLPRALAPGEAIYLQADAPFEFLLPEPQSRIRYYHPDHLGSLSAVSDAGGAVVQTAAFHPFGVPRPDPGHGQPRDPYLFTQKERDREGGLHYFEARYLAGGLARFATTDLKLSNPDTLSAEDLGSLLLNPQQGNPYAYVRNRPLSETDPTGLQPRRSGGAARRISTPLDGRDAVRQRNGNVVVTLKNDVRVTILPDRFDLPEDSDAKTSADIVPSPRGIGPGTRRITYRITLQTRYPRGADPSKKAGYGRGTTPEDIKSGDTSWGFHEGQHGERILDYLEAHDLPKLNPENRRHTAEWTWRDAAIEWKGAMENYQDDLEESHVQATDCVGHIPTFCK